MIWHVVRLDFTSVDDALRAEIEDELRGLERLDEVAWLRLARDVEDAGVTGLLTGFVDRDALEAYRTHPEHRPVVERFRAAGVTAVRLDIETDDGVERLP